ncbi:MAG: RNA-binding cell elongation regulator Jag/EloR [Dehalococcoidia bacterium]|jgi:spoIIIJ-associated protein
MENVDASGKTVEEAVEKALAQLGLERAQVEIEVVKEGRGGILGIGGEDARVIVRAKAAPGAAKDVESAATEEDDEGDVESAVEVLETLLSLLGVDATVRVRQPETPGDGVALVKAVLDISGDDLGILIGRRGETLSSLQYIVNLMVGRRLKTRTAFGVDVAGYRRRREESLKSLAMQMAARVKSSGQIMTLEPMPPNERRIVHLALAQDASVITESIGEGENRKVVIRPS